LTAEQVASRVPATGAAHGVADRDQVQHHLSRR
jgi:hypothetical protein